MTEYGKNIDTEANIVSLCPTCHRRIHLGSKDEKTGIIERLYEIKRVELRKIGIVLTLDKLKSVYGIHTTDAPDEGR